MATEEKRISKDSTGDTVSKKLYTRAEVANHKDNNEIWIIIHNSVYNVTEFLNEHPGGEEVLIEQAGKDATEPFEDIGHSSDARKMMEPYKIGELVEEEASGADKKNNGSSDSYGGDSSSDSWSSWVISFALGVLVSLVYRYFTSAQ